MFTHDFILQNIRVLTSELPGQKEGGPVNVLCNDF